ncbi:MAG TPA: GAF domain-containing SpoIIE family protein phosphatase, partial [Streptomyces sp.]
PEVTDRYEAASLSERPTSFPALRPPDHWLSFRLYPDTSGISIRIMPSGTPGKPLPARPAALALGPTRAPILHHLMALAAKLTEAVTVQDVFDRTAGQIMPVLGARALALMAADEGRLRVLGHRGFSDALMDGFEATPLASGIPATHVLTTGETLFFARSEELLTAYPPAVEQDGMASWAFLPLRASGRSIGSLILAYDQPQAFPPTERAVLTSLAELIGQAVERARLYDTQHAVSRRLQAALLPRALPDLPGWTVVARYRPAGPRTDVGGDFYDLLRLDDIAAAAVIGDVQGHNIDAAALMGQVRTAIHAHATSGVPPAEVLRRTNRLLIELDRDLLTSVLYARLDLAGHRADLANAGHTWPLLRHPHGGIEILRPPAGLLLGVDREAEYPPMDISLQPGCTLLLYTDGLIEKPGVDPDDAVAALCELLGHTDPGSLEDMADTLLRHAPDPTDDISLLLISPDRPATGPRAP